MSSNNDYLRLLEELELVRTVAEGNPRPLVEMLAGDGLASHGILDSVASGILKETGWAGKRNAERQDVIKRVMDEHRKRAVQELVALLGEPPSIAELAAEATVSTHSALQAFRDDHYGPPEPKAPTRPRPAPRHDPAIA